MKRRRILIRIKGIDSGFKPVCFGLLPSINPVCVSMDILGLGFFVQWYANSEEPVGGELWSDGGRRAFVGI